MKTLSAYLTEAKTDILSYVKAYLLDKQIIVTNSYWYSKDIAFVTLDKPMTFDIPLPTTEWHIRTDDSLTDLVINRNHGNLRFPDNIRFVYHVCKTVSLQSILDNGIRLDFKVTYEQSINRRRANFVSLSKDFKLLSKVYRHSISGTANDYTVLTIDLSKCRKDLLFYNDHIFKHNQYWLTYGDIPAVAIVKHEPLLNLR